jgi:cellobiose transport system permease protein
MSLSTTTTTPPRRFDQPGHFPPGPTRLGRLSRWDTKASPYLYVAPFFIIFGIFGLYPMVWTFWMSLHKWNLISPDTATFIGLDNYGQLLSNAYFWNSVKNTIGMFLLATIPQLLIALFLANLLNRPALKAKTFFRLAIFIPNATSVAAVAIVFGMLFQRDFGVINWVLSLFGVKNLDWHNAVWHVPVIGNIGWSSWTAIATMVDWRWTGYNTLILLAGMQAIPRDLYESAAIDGASQWKQFWSITLPMLRPTFLFVTVVSIIGGLQLFTEPLLFNNGVITGGAQRQFQTVTMYMYENSIENTNQAGYGASVAWALFLMIIVASLANFLLIRRTVK